MLNIKKIEMNIKSIKLTLVCIALFFTSSVKADAGFFAPPLGAALAYTQDGGSMVTTTSFGVNIGNASSLILNGGFLHTWKDANGNICSGTLNYRLYPQASTPSGAFTQVALAFSSGHSFTTTATPANINSGGGNDQRWGQTTGTTDLVSGLVVGTPYTLEFYFEASGSTANSFDCNENLFYSNGGFNYTIAFTPTAPVPVKLIDFSAFLNDEGHTELRWSTASEYNASHFTIYKSVDGLEKRAVGKVRASGNSTATVNYSFIDNEFIAKDALYFLEQVDYDGKTEWYGPVKVNTSENERITAFISSNDVLQINSTVTDSYKTATLFSLDGKQVLSIELTTSAQQVSLPSMQAGLYLLEVSDGSNTTVLKIIK